MRKYIFQNGEYYHIYNRGVEKREIFIGNKDYFRFIVGLNLFNRADAIGSIYMFKKGSEAFRKASDPLVDIVCYNLVKNHYHLIVKQLQENGISKFIQKVALGYANYFNIRYERSGALFQGKYKSVHIKANEYLLYLSAYVNGNAEIHQIENAIKWQWSSYRDYLDLRSGKLCNKKVILSQFKNVKDYQGYVSTVIKESAKRKNEIKQYLLE